MNTFMDFKAFQDLQLLQLEDVLSEMSDHDKQRLFNYYNGQRQNLINLSPACPFPVKPKKGKKR